MTIKEGVGSTFYGGGRREDLWKAVSNRREDRHSYVRTLSSSDRNQQLIYG